MLDHSAQSGRAPLREHRGDFYDTPPIAVTKLMAAEPDFFGQARTIWECACGTGNIVRQLRAAGHEVIATDLNNRGCYDSRFGIDFLFPMVIPPIECDAIVTNPPFVLAQQFVELAIERAPYVAMLLRLAFLESERRSNILDDGALSHIHVFKNRLPMMHRHGWIGKTATSSIAFAWFVWDRAHKGATTIDRI
jgi:hypothetical protein